MSFQMIRRSAKFDVDWGEQFVAEPLSESATQDVGEFYHRIQAPLYRRPEGGTIEQGVHEVDRWLEHHRSHGDVELAMQASTLVRLRATGQLVAVCLINADRPDHVRKVLHPVASIQMIDVRHLRRDSPGHRVGVFAVRAAHGSTGDCLCPSWGELRVTAMILSRGMNTEQAH